MDVFHHHLEAVEGTCLRDLDFCAEALRQIFKHNPIASCEECQHILYEMLLVFGEFGPIPYISAEVDLVNGPEACHLFFIHLPNILILDGQDHEAVRILLEQRLG